MSLYKLTLAIPLLLQILFSHTLPAAEENTLREHRIEHTSLLYLCRWIHEAPPEVDSLPHKKLPFAYAVLLFNASYPDESTLTVKELMNGARTIQRINVSPHRRTKAYGKAVIIQTKETMLEEPVKQALQAKLEIPDFLLQDSLNLQRFWSNDVLQAYNKPPSLNAVFPKLFFLELTAEHNKYFHEHWHLDSLKMRSAFQKFMPNRANLQPHKITSMEWTWRLLNEMWPKGRIDSPRERNQAEMPVQETISVPEQEEQEEQEEQDAITEPGYNPPSPDPQKRKKIADDFPDAIAKAAKFSFDELERIMFEE